VGGSRNNLRNERHKRIDSDALRVEALQLNGHKELAASHLLTFYLLTGARRTCSSTLYRQRMTRCGSLLVYGGCGRSTTHGPGTTIQSSPLDGEPQALPSSTSFAMRPVSSGCGWNTSCTDVPQSICEAGQAVLWQKVADMAEGCFWSSVGS